MRKPEFKDLTAQAQSTPESQEAPESRGNPELRAIPELLLPCGDFESVAAAVYNGANAIYLGGTDFSARQNAKNFSAEDLFRAVSFCHARDVLVYLALNTIIFNSQLPQLKSAIKAACLAGVDAIITQDLAVLTLVKRHCPSMPLHASTQMSVHSVMGARLLHSLGFSRVVLAREMSLAAIREITALNIIETEVFVHGALCMSVSGQCYISAMLGGRSGNRGSCAGTCRMPFRAGGSSSASKAKGADASSYDLSLKDLCLLEHSKLLIEAGVTSFKIEGRMKRPEYVAASAAAYSNAIKNLPYDEQALQAVFSRGGFTSGYLAAPQSVSKEAPGISKETSSSSNEMFGMRQKEDVTAATNKLLKGLQNTYQKEVGLVPLNMRLTAKAGEPISLLAYDEKGNLGKAEGAIPEAAIHRATTLEDVTAALKKLGGTIFYANAIMPEVEEALMLPISQLNELRRQVCATILEKREKVIPVEFFEEAQPIKPFLDDTPQEKPAPTERDSQKLFARYEKFTQLSPTRIASLRGFSLPLDEVIANASALLPYAQKLYIEPDRLMLTTKNNNAEKLADGKLAGLKQRGFCNLLANNLASVELARTLGFNIMGGAFLNCSNSLSMETLSALSVKAQTLSFELTLADANALIRLNNTPAKLQAGLIVYGYLPLMLCKTCPMKRKAGYGSCEACSAEYEGARETRRLTDRLNKSFPLLCHSKRYTEILNCNPLWLADRMHEVHADFLMYYFTTETAVECEKVFTDFESNSPYKGEFTRGLYYRGVGSN